MNVGYSWVGKGGSKTIAIYLTEQIITTQGEAIAILLPHFTTHSYSY